VIVVDASAVVEWLLGREGARAVAARFDKPGETLHAPALLSIEVLAALRGLLNGGHVHADRCRRAVEDLLALDVELYDPMLLVARVWELRDNLSAYDASYVALAELLGAPLLTADRRMSRASGHGAEIHVV
jgi:predicted nucleic acid-binding protein